MNWRTLAGAVLIAALFVPAKAEALETNELLALVAMPLAVAAVSEVTDVPMSDLLDVVTLLNDANVPPVQFVEVVRYAPVALVVEEPTRTPFVDFIRTRYDAGVLGVPLVTEIEREIRFYGVPDIELDVVAPRLIDRDADFIPLPVRTRITEYRREHPHGGPPGQLKKERGLQTGAEVVHGTRRGNDRDVAREVRREERTDKAERKAEKAEQKADKRVERQVEKRERQVEKRVEKQQQKQEKHENRGHDSGKSNGGQGKGKGKGKG
jgi:hypothetical protein